MRSRDASTRENVIYDNKNKIFSRKVSECIVGQSIIIDGGSRLCCNIDMSDFKEQMAKA